VHSFAAGYWWAAGVLLAAAIICGALIRPKTFTHDITVAPPIDELIGRTT
jgi:hypothetical protein